MTSSHPADKPRQDAPPARRARDRKRRVADVLLDTLSELGVDRIFGLPGGAISPLYDALLDHSALPVITVRHEASAIYAAAGYAWTSGRVPIVLVTSGPGATNALTALASVFADSVPLVLVVGEVPRQLQGKGALQDGSAQHLDVLAVARLWSKAAIEIREPAAAPALLRRAVITARSGKPGPVTVTIPMDVASDYITVPEMSAEVYTAFDLPELAAERTAERLAKSRRGAIFAGSGVRAGRGCALLRDLAERLGWPVMTTPKGKGAFPESHPLSLGIFGIGGHPSAARYLDQGIETLLVVGTSLGDFATDGWASKLFPSRCLIHVDVDSSVIGRNYPADVAITAPAELFLEAMLWRLPERDGPHPRFGVERFGDASQQEGGRIRPDRAIWEIQQVLAGDTIYAIDSGEHFVFAAHHLELDRPDSFVAMTGLGAMGSSISAGLGAQLAHPDRTVAVIIGDGGYAMIGNDIATAVAEKLPLRVFVFNDGRLAMCEIGHENVYGRSPSFPVPALDIVDNARSMGASALRVQNPRDITGAKALIADPEGPVVVDVQIDPDVRLPKTDRIGAMGESR